VGIVLSIFAATYAADRIEMRLSSTVPPMHVINSAALAPWCEALLKKTDGRLKITLFPAQALGKVAQQYDLVLEGAADLALITPGYMPGRFPLTSMINLPFLAPQVDKINNAFWRLFKETPGLKKEYDPVKVISAITTDPMQIYTTKKPIRNLQDLKGLQLRVPTDTVGRMISHFGAVPVMIPIQETYMALQKGTVDGTIASLEGAKPFKLNEVAKYITLMGLSLVDAVVGMNNESWDRLPADIQALIRPDGELGGDWISQHNADGYNVASQVGYDLLKQSGVEIITLSPEEMIRFRERVQPITDTWVAEMEAKGLPGKRILNRLIQISAEIK
jgi:TRAP-type C4-dicarboxylate transport system substrate-binding protein